jgi:hypothetical protein
MEHDMPQDDLSALNAKMDFLIGTVREQGEKIAHLQRQFDASKGALNLIKTMAWLAGVAAAIWAAWHTGIR